MNDGFDPYVKWLGIRETARPINHYRLLGLELFEDGAHVILAAADRQMMHVRKFGSGHHAGISQQVLNELATAKLCLLNPLAKAAYDAHLRAAMGLSPPYAAPTNMTAPVVPTPAAPAMPRAPGSFSNAPAPVVAGPSAYDFLERLEQAPAAVQAGPSMEEENRKRSSTSTVVKGLAAAWTLMVVCVIVARFTIWDSIFPPPPPMPEGPQRKVIVRQRVKTVTPPTAEELKAERLRLKLLHPFRGHTSGVWALAVDPAGRWAVSGGVGGEVKCWNLVDWDDPPRETTSDPFIQAMLLLPSQVGAKPIDAALPPPADLNGLPTPRPAPPKTAETDEPAQPEVVAVFGGREPLLHLWDVNAGAKQRFLQTPTAVRLAVSRDFGLVASASESGEVVVVSYPQAAPVKRWSAHQGSIIGLGFLPNNQLLTSGVDGRLHHWSLDEQNPIKTWETFPSGATTFAVSPDGAQCAAGDRTGRLRWWNTANAGLLGESRPSQRELRGLSFSPTGRSLAVVGVDPAVVVWNVAENQLLASGAGHKAAVLSVRFLPDSVRLLTASADGLVHLWQLP